MTDLRQAAHQALDELTEYMHPSDAMLMRCHPKLIAASQTLRSALAAAPQAEPLFLLHTGQIDSDGEQDEWETEADSQVRVDAFCRQHPGQTIGLYPAPAPAADVVRDAERWRVSNMVHEAGWKHSTRQTKAESVARSAYQEAVSKGLNHEAATDAAIAAMKGNL